MQWSNSLRSAPVCFNVNFPVFMQVLFFSCFEYWILYASFLQFYIIYWTWNLDVGEVLYRSLCWQQPEDKILGTKLLMLHLWFQLCLDVQLLSLMYTITLCKLLSATYHGQGYHVSFSCWNCTRPGKQLTFTIIFYVSLIIWVFHSKFTLLSLNVLYLFIDASMNTLYVALFHFSWDLQVKRMKYNQEWHREL